MNKLVKVLLGVLGVFVLGIAAIFYFTADMANTADDFFAAVQSRDMDKAYLLLSEDFKTTTSKEELERYLEKNSITQFKEASWESRSVSGGRGSLTGSITTDSGGVVPITLNFVKGEAGWKIYSIQKPASGIQEESSPIQMPSEQDQIQLVAESMRAFSESLNNLSMAGFHSHVSNLWQQQFTVENFEEAFGGFYNIGVDLTVLENYSPQFNSKPSIDENGVLAIAGLYPTQPNQVHFEQKYIYEGVGWKLIGFSVNIR